MKKLTNYKGETLYLVILHEQGMSALKSRTTIKFVWADEDIMSKEYCEGLFDVRNGVTEDSVDAQVDFYPVNPDPTHSKTIMEELR